MAQQSQAASNAVPVAILGAGLTGMSAAFHLRKAGLKCRIFERLGLPGGHAVTLEERGYRFDRTGHLLHLADADLRALALRWIGPEHHELERRSVVWSHGVYTRYPFQANTFGLPPKVAYECLMGFLDAQGEEPAERIESFEQYCLAKFGRGIAEHFMIPYNTRLWGVAPSEISADWCGRFVPEPQLEDVVAGALGYQQRELGYNQRFIYPHRGIGQLSEGLAAELGDVELGRDVQVIDTEGATLKFADEDVAYQALVSTVPLPRLISLCEGVPVEVREAAGRLRCTHLYYLDIALTTPCSKPYHWVYVPEAKYPFYRVGCYSHFSEQMAPPNMANLYVELADRAEPDIEAVLPEVSAALSEMGLIPGPEAIAFCRVRRIDHAYVIYDHQYQSSRDQVLRFLEQRRIISVGRYGGWNYSSMGDALGFGREAAVQASSLVRAGELP